MPVLRSVELNAVALLGPGGQGVEDEQGGDGEERAQPRADFRSEDFFMALFGRLVIFYCSVMAHAANHA